MKETLYTKYADVVAPYLTNGVIDPNHYKTVLTSIHTAAVTQSIADLGTNHLINIVPPEICVTEKFLKQRERTLLAQLRSGDSICLLSYLKQSVWSVAFDVIRPVTYSVVKLAPLLSRSLTYGHTLLP